MLNVPQYYFSDIPGELMREIVDEMPTLAPEPRLEEIGNFGYRYLDKQTT